MKKWMILLSVAVVILALTGCDVENEKGNDIPAYIPIFGIDGGSAGRSIQADAFSETEFSILAYTPIFNGLKRNTANYSAGDSFDVILWNASLAVDIEKNIDTYLFSGEFSDGSGFLKVTINETTNKISYVQGIEANVISDGKPYKVLVYYCIPNGNIEDISMLSIHSHCIALLICETPDGTVASFSGGEIFIANDPSDQPLDISYSTIAGFLGYDIRPLPDIGIPVAISSLNRYVELLKKTSAECVPWSLDAIDPAGLEDFLYSYYYVVYRRRTNLVGMARGELESFGGLSSIEGEWWAIGGSATGTFTGPAWTMLDGKSYNRSVLIDNIVPIPES
ncbi:MAG: hypothetical protein JW881_09510 [Spirochaetales bacterium]|nr:hypothetical protein [Spirochaetales bacterium]